MDPDDTIAEFQRRRRRAARLAGPWILFAVAGLVLTHYLWQDKDWREIAVIAFVACATIGAIVGVSIYRCPKCDTVPFDGDDMPLNPVRCHRCGASLR